MNAHHTDALDRAIGRIVDAMRPEAIYLFGSHARGDAGADSDYDLLVIVPDDTPNGMRLLEETARVPPPRPRRTARHCSLPPKRFRTPA
jgi:predicted nucleotidyltransferase